MKIKIKCVKENLRNTTISRTDDFRCDVNSYIHVHYEYAYLYILCVNGLTWRNLFLKECQSMSILLNRLCCTHFVCLWSSYALVVFSFQCKISLLYIFDLSTLIYSGLFILLTSLLLDTWVKERHLSGLVNTFCLS